jgi:IS30 family transposase
MVRMPRYAPNKMPGSVKRRYFELIRSGVRGAEAARRVGVSMSCGSVWFIDAGGVHIIETPSVSSRFLSQNERIAIADGLATGIPVKLIAERIGKSFQTVYREKARNQKPDGTYQPWYAHNQAHVRRRRAKPRRLETDSRLRGLVQDKLDPRWSPEQVCRWLRRRYPRHRDWHLSWETIYDGIYRGLLGRTPTTRLRTGRVFRHRRGRGRSSFPRMPAMRSIHQRPRHVESRRQAGHWEGDLIIGERGHSAIATLVERKTRFTILVAS